LVESERRNVGVFRIWSRVEKLGLARYGAMVAAVPVEKHSGPRHEDIRRRTFRSPHVAEMLMPLMAQSLRDVLAARGDRIVDTP
jgi:hypothetical protein